MKFYDAKEAVYFTNPRIDLIKLIPRKHDNRILEIGAGGGDTLIEIKRQNLASMVVGIELMEMLHSNQKSGEIDKFIICDVERTELEFPEAYFDVILLGDVIEHLLDPWSFLKKTSRFLKPGGLFIASIPNIRYYTAMIRIFLKGDFGYDEQGLFDRTHFRFFCKRNMKSLFNTQSFRCLKIMPRDQLYQIRSKRKVFNRLTFGLFEEFLTLQYIIVSEKV
jgi:2-polyprenyl-3-methyl-5-hydroxy-6-metoxy-1,4-benzoquinol methylase